MQPGDIIKQGFYTIKQERDRKFWAKMAGIGVRPAVNLMIRKSSIEKRESMTDKEFRRLSRADLIEIIYELQQNEKILQQEKEELTRKLAERQEVISETDPLKKLQSEMERLIAALQQTQPGGGAAGAEAERLLREARMVRSQADEYMEDIRKQAERCVSIARQQCRDMLAAAKKECAQLHQEAGSGK